MNQIAHDEIMELQESLKLLRRRNNTLTRDLEALIERYNAIERLLENLTPGGSEFAGSPARCAEWVRERLASTGRLAAERNRLRDATQGLVELVDNLTSGDIFDEEGVCTYCSAPTGYGDRTHYPDCLYLELRAAVSYWKEVSG